MKNSVKTGARFTDKSDKWLKEEEANSPGRSAVKEFLHSPHTRKASSPKEGVTLCVDLIYLGGLSVPSITLEQGSPNFLAGGPYQISGTGSRAGKINVNKHNREETELME